ncbi:hypothetical protein D3C72_2258470 [compost metagenome]
MASAIERSALHSRVISSGDITLALALSSSAIAATPLSCAGAVLAMHRACCCSSRSQVGTPVTRGAWAAAASCDQAANGATASTTGATSPSRPALNQ